jgi:16S rRNA U516 pseudouridylate synthase RsuA-like enzyme
MGETNSPSVAHVGYDISSLSRVKLKNLNLTLLSGEISQSTGN